MVRLALEFPIKLVGDEEPADVVARQFRCEVERLRKFVTAGEINPGDVPPPPEPRPRPTKPEMVPTRIRRS